MNLIYLSIFIFLVFQRIFELLFAKSNERYQKKKGAIEINDPYYKAIVITHVLFFICLLTESYFTHYWLKPISIYIFIIFVILQFFRLWCIFSLGRYWNTKIIVLPNSHLVSKGPYKWIKHPNYIIVGLEFITIPILFHAYTTAVIFTFAHYLLMRKRIPMENEALKLYIIK